MRRHLRWKIFLIFLQVFVTTTVQGHVCDQLKEHCTYKCHCNSSCAWSTGMCRNLVPCDKGWFGTRCQYEDLVTISEARMEFTPLKRYQSIVQSLLTDRDDSTCVNDLQSVTVSWDIEYPLTYVRIATNEPEKVFRIKLSYTVTKSYKECEIKQYTRIGQGTVDIRCEDNALMKSLKIAGNISLCSIYISGGRNLAFAQTAINSDTYIEEKPNPRDNFIAYGSLAVDGNTNSDFSNRSCSHTDTSKPDPRFDLIFKEGGYNVHRIKLYNRNEFQDRLKHFRLVTRDVNQKIVDNYKDTTSGSAPMIYNINLSARRPVYSLYIHESGPYLTICEIEVFGECPPGKWSLPCKRNCNRDCPTSCDRDDGLCNIICDGQTNPPECKDNACETGEFCKYQCHCNNSCPIDNGMCSRHVPCDKGWFGTRCQYQDLVTIPGAKIENVPTQTIKVLTDRDDKTCAKGLQELIISWDIEYPLTYVRLVSADPDMMFTVRLNYNIRKDYKECVIQKWSRIDQGTVDIRCEDNALMKSLKIAGNMSSLCSLYISGGRNVAYYQTATQSSVYEEELLEHKAEARLAVDGNTDPDFFHYSCSHTDKYDPAPQFNIFFNVAFMVYRVKLYNRDIYQDRLKHFRLITMNANYMIVDDYRDTSASAKSTYHINCNARQPILFLSINETEKVADEGYPFPSAVALCEVEVFGECPPGRWSLPCTKICNSSCPTSCHRDDGSCNNVCVGRSNPPECNKACAPNKWGINCVNDCNTRCVDTSCDSKSGHCNRGCLGYSDPPYCTKECSGNGLWGINCNQQCRCTCVPNKCNIFTGACDPGCVDGDKPHRSAKATGEIIEGMGSFKSGVIVGSGITVFFVVLLLIITVFFVQLRKTTQKKKINKEQRETFTSSSEVYEKMELQATSRQLNNSVEI